jgi:hypothetical protein
MTPRRARCCSATLSIAVRYLHLERLWLLFAGISGKRSLGMSQTGAAFAHIQGGGASTGGSGGVESWHIRLTNLHFLAYVPATKQIDGQTGPDREAKQRARKTSGSRNIDHHGNGRRVLLFPWYHIRILGSTLPKNAQFLAIESFRPWIKAARAFASIFISV